MALLLSAAMLLSGCGILKSNKGSETAATSGISTKYASKLFDTSYVHKINIKINASDWSDLLKNPIKKTKYKADVTIDGETVDKVSFSTKGNTSLSSIASSDSSDKYSFKINFGKYIDDQTYYGLNKLNLNNIYVDSTKSIKKLSDGIEGLPTKLDDVVSQTQQLTSITGDLNKSTDTVLALNNAIVFVSCDNNDDVPMPADNTITGLAVKNPNLKILVQALTRAELATSLQGTGPFTVFAPTDAAFTAFLKTTQYATINDVPKDVLTQILLNHVVSGSVKSTALTTGYIKTLS